MPPGPVEVARLAKRLFEQAHPERFWSLSSRRIGDRETPDFATDLERQSFLDVAKGQLEIDCAARRKVRRIGKPRDHADTVARRILPSSPQDAR